MISTKKKYDYKSSIRSKLVCKDQLVTGEDFEIEEYEKGILKTLPVPEDLSRYYESDAYISHSDSSRNLQDKIYQFVKSYMLSKKATWINEYFKEGKILDYGAGTGEFLNKMRSGQWDVEGVEPNKQARELGLSKGLKIKPDLSAIEKDNYTIISLWHVLEHIPDFEIKVRKFRRLLADDGILIIAVPNYNSYDANYYKEHWAAWDVPRHLWHFSRSGLKNKLSDLGFDLLDEKPLLFDSFYVSLLSEKSKSPRTNFLNAIYRGFLSNLKASKTGEYSSIVYFFKNRG